jgi:hypothetical protein
MPAFHEVVDSPVKVAMLLICLFGAAFMLWFLAGLITDWTRVRQTFVVRFGAGEDQAVGAWEGQQPVEILFDKTRSIKRRPDWTSDFPVRGLRMKRHFKLGEERLCETSFF